MATEKDIINPQSTEVHEGIGDEYDDAPVQPPCASKQECTLRITQDTQRNRLRDVARVIMSMSYDASLPVIEQALQCLNIVKDMMLAEQAQALVGAGESKAGIACRRLVGVPAGGLVLPCSRARWCAQSQEKL